MTTVLPTNSAARNAIPMADGLLYYFPNALAAVAEVSRIGNEQHNPGQPLHHARHLSTDHANKIMRHLVDAGTFDSDGARHSAKVAWRALALLQEEIERQDGVPMARNARLPAPSVPSAPAPLVVAGILTELSDDDTGLNHGTAAAPAPLPRPGGHS